ncbi:DUF4214 domain-containing protein [Sulfurimonas sp. NW15]|uniref:DUF4214 domain-containing protein n=1 Tax=Sulfurimonas sp. NW15 TaxID=2922729 RepID=UPI003DA9D8A0
MKKLILVLISLTLLTVTLYAKTVSTEQKIAGLYVAFFNRAPDMSGLSYWTKRANAVQANGQSALVVLKELSAGFATHPVFTSTYSSLDNESFVKAIYINSLGREGDAEGIAYWTNLLNNGLSRSDMVATFIEMSLTLDLTPQNFPNLSQSELDAAILRQNLITNKTVVAIDFVSKLGERTDVADPQDPEDDPAYKASIKILSTVNEDPATVSAAVSYLNTVAQSADPIQKILDEWGVDTLKNTATVLSLHASLNGFDLIDTLIPGEEAKMRVSQTPAGAVKVELQTANGSKEIIPVYMADENITFVAPLDTVAGTLKLKSADFSTFGISYKTMSDKTPFIESVEPEVAKAGDIVTITGKNLPSGNALVKFETQDADSSVSATVSDSKVTFQVPDTLQSGTFHLEFSNLKTNTLYLSVKRDIPLHVTLAEGVDINASDISFTEGQKEYTLDTAYNTLLSVENKTMQYVHAFAALPGGEYVALYSAVVLPDMTTLNADCKSTAIAWLFMGMGVSATMPENQLSALYNRLSSEPKVQALADAIASLQKEDFTAWANLSDGNLKTVFQDALKEVINYYNSPAANAKQVQTSDATDNAVVITQDPPNDNIYVDDNKYIFEIKSGKLNDGSVNVVNDTRLFLSIEVRDKKTGEIIRNYSHGDPFSSASILGPKGWPLFGISSLKNLRLSGRDAHIEIIAGAKEGVTDKQKLATLLMIRVWLEGVGAPALNMLLSTIIDKKIQARYGDNYSVSRRMVTALSDIYGANFMVQLTEQIARGNSNWSTLTKDFIINPVKNGLQECFEHGVTSTKCEQTAKGIAELIGMGNTEHIVNKLMIMVASAGEKYILKKSVALVPVIGWITEASFFVYDNISVLSDTGVIAESIIDMGANPKEINAYIDFPFEVSSVAPLCVAQTAGKTIQTFSIGGKGMSVVDGNTPEVSMGILSDKVEAESVFVPTTGTDLVADFSLDALLGNGSRTDYLAVTNFGYTSVYPEPVRMVSAQDSKLYFDSAIPENVTPGTEIVLKGCGWVPLSEVEVTFPNADGEALPAAIVSKNINEIRVIVPVGAVSGYIHVKTSLKNASRFFNVKTFSLSDAGSDTLEDGESLTVYGKGLDTVAHIYFVDHENQIYEGDIVNVTDTEILTDKVPAGLAVGPVRIYALLDNGTKSNEITLLKLPKPPVATPSGGWFEESISVTLTQQNSADIYYKLNETNSSEKLYTEALTFNADNTTQQNFNLYTFSRVNVNGINYDSHMNHYVYNICKAGEKIAYDEDGSEYCAAEDENNSLKELYTYEDWKLECPADMTLEKKIDTDYKVERYQCVGIYEHKIKEVYYSDDAMQNVSSENDFILLPFEIEYEFYSTNNVHSIDYFESGQKHTEYFYAYAKGPYGTYISLNDGVTIWYENGNKASESFFVQKKNRDGTWSSVYLKTREYFENGNLKSEALFEPELQDDGDWYSVKTKFTQWNENGTQISEELFVPKKDNDGYWRPVPTQSTLWYDNGIMREKKIYINQLVNGSWTGLISNDTKWNDDGVKIEETIYVPVKYPSSDYYYISAQEIRTYDPENGQMLSKEINEAKYQPVYGFVDLHKDEWFWYENGKLKSEYHYEIKQDSDGYWNAFLVDAKTWYENGTQSSQVVATLSQDNNGDWYIASKVTKEWYASGNIHFISTDEAVFLNGVWQLRTVSYEDWADE